MPTPPGQPALQVRLELRDVEPPVWRQLLVPGSVRLDKLHRMFQAAMGWENRHLHYFAIDDAWYGMQFDEYPDEELDETTVTVMRRQWVPPSGSPTSTTSATPGNTTSVSSGARGYPSVSSSRCAWMARVRAHPKTAAERPATRISLRALADPTHDEYEHLRDWVGGDIDPDEFDLALANARVADRPVTT